MAFVNAGDKALGDLLVRLPEVSRLAAYGGWNTAGNTLGCVLSQAVIRHLQVQLGASAVALVAHVRFLFLRIVEDYLFMAQLRSQIAVQALPAIGLPITLGNLGEHAETVRALVVALGRPQPRPCWQASALPDGASRRARAQSSWSRCP